MNYYVGDKIKIIFLDDDMSGGKYNGKEGVITYIDSIGQLHGTWGGIAIIPKIDIIEKIK